MLARGKNRGNGNIFEKFRWFVETSLRTKSRVRSIALRFYNARSRSGSDGPTMSVPMARETLCQATERILIITRARYRPVCTYTDDRGIRERMTCDLRLCVLAQFNEITNREFGIHTVKGLCESNLQTSCEFGLA